MNKLFFTCLGISAIFCGSVNIASAADIVIYDGGAPSLDQDAIILNNGYTPAQQFSLTDGNTTINGVNFWTWQFPESQFNGSIGYSFYSNRNDLPAPVSFYNGTSSDVVVTDLGLNSLGYENYEYSFRFQAPVSFPGQTPLWLALNTDTTDGTSVYWDNTTVGANTAGLSTDFAIGNPLFTNFWRTSTDVTGANEQLAFQFIGKSATVPPVEVPEPSNFLAAFFALGTLAWLKSKLKSTH